MLAKILILVLFVQSAFSRPHKDDDEGRIVGGAKSTIDQHPYQVAVNFGDFMCGGALIAPNVVATAAHCTEHDAVTRSGGIVRAGSNGFYSGIEKGVKNIYDHEDYQSIRNDVIGTTYPDNDISILHLDSAYDLSSTIQTIDIASYERKTGDKMTVSGWGRTISSDSKSTSPYSLKDVEIPFISMEDCRKSASYVDEGFALTDHMICAGNLDKNGNNTCKGDSGGPLVNDGELTGLVSWAKGCATAGFPSVFVNIFYYKDWIQDILDKISKEELNNEESNNEEIDNGESNNEEIDNGEFNNGVFNPGVFSPGKFNNDDFFNDDFNNGGFNNDNFFKDPFNNGGFNNDNFFKDPFNNGGFNNGVPNNNFYVVRPIYYNPPLVNYPFQNFA